MTRAQNRESIEICLPQFELIAQMMVLDNYSNLFMLRSSCTTECLIWSNQCSIAPLKQHLINSKFLEVGTSFVYKINYSTNLKKNWNFRKYKGILPNSTF